MSICHPLEECCESAQRPDLSHDPPIRDKWLHPIDTVVGGDERPAHPAATTSRNPRSMAPVPDEIAGALHHEPVEEVVVAEQQDHDCHRTEVQQLPAEPQTNEPEPDLKLVNQLMNIETTDRRKWIHQMVLIISAKSWQYL